MIDIYCERCGPAWNAEPLNTSTNAAFLIAAAAAWRLARRTKSLTVPVATLVVLAAAVGLGSALFHMVPTPLTRLFDVVPILLFQFWFLWLYLRRAVELSVRTSVAVIVVWLGVSLLTAAMPPLLNGSILYIGTLVALIAAAVFHYESAQPERWLLPVGAVLFVVALVFRTVDEAVCPAFPIGTHFLWHVLNGCVCYVAMRAVILTAHPPADRSPARPDGTR